MTGGSEPADRSSGRAARWRVVETMAGAVASLLLVALAQSVSAQGAKCDLTKCMCGGVDLSSMMNKVFKAPQDAEGYAYSLSICGEIPKASLPSGCQQYAEHPSVVKVSSIPAET